MPWKRGKGTVEVELANVQSYIETVDPILYGQNGNPGMIREFYDDRAKRIQHDEDMRVIRRLVLWLISPSAGLTLIAEVLRVFKLVK